MSPFLVLVPIAAKSKLIVQPAPVACQAEIKTKSLLSLDALISHGEIQVRLVSKLLSLFLFRACTLNKHSQRKSKKSQEHGAHTKSFLVVHKILLILLR